MSMSNIFKTQKQDRKDKKDNKNTKDNKNNIKHLFNIKTKINTNETFDIKESDFPELEKKYTQENITTNEQFKDLNFKEASLKENITDKDKENLIPNGWTIYRMIDNKIVIDGHLKNNTKKTKDYHSMAYRTFNLLIDKWDNYKNYYDELNGFGEYDRVYNIPIDSFIENEDYEESADNYEFHFNQNYEHFEDYDDESF